MKFNAMAGGTMASFMALKAGVVGGCHPSVMRFFIAPWLTVETNGNLAGFRGTGALKNVNMRFRL
jgi:hypothetical protein